MGRANAVLVEVEIETSVLKGDADVLSAGNPRLTLGECVGLNVPR